MNPGDLERAKVIILFSLNTFSLLFGKNLSQNCPNNIANTILPYSFLTLTCLIWSFLRSGNQRSVSAQRGRRLPTVGEQILPGPGRRRRCQHHAGFVIPFLKDWGTQLSSNYTLNRLHHFHTWPQGVKGVGSWTIAPLLILLRRFTIVIFNNKWEESHN